MYVYNFRAEKLPKKYPTTKPKTNRFNMGILEVALKDEYMGETFGDERMAKVQCVVIVNFGGGRCDAEPRSCAS